MAAVGQWEPVAQLRDRASDAWSILLSPEATWLYGSLVTWVGQSTPSLPRRRSAAARCAAVQHMTRGLRPALSFRTGPDDDAIGLNAKFIGALCSA